LRSSAQVAVLNWPAFRSHRGRSNIYPCIIQLSSGAAAAPGVRTKESPEAPENLALTSKE
jgi:hypothetical protein